MRLTALDVMTNGPIANPVTIDADINWMNHTTLPSPATIYNVPPNALIFAIATESSTIQSRFPVVLTTRAKDVLGTGIMDLTMMMAPRIVRHSKSKSFQRDLIFFILSESWPNENHFELG